MNKKTIGFGMLGIGLLFFWQCATNPTEPDGPGANEIWFQNSSVTPRTLTVSRGTNVRWINMSGETHSVDSGTFMNPTTDFGSQNLGPNASFPHTFGTAGSFSFYCSIHQSRASETGSVVVQ
jgi:plastocyanin